MAKRVQLKDIEGFFDGNLGYAEELVDSAVVRKAHRAFCSENMIHPKTLYKEAIEGYRLDPMVLVCQ